MADPALRMLHVADAFRPETGGVERVCLELSRSLVRLGHRVTVLTKTVDQAPSRETFEGIEVLRYPYSRAWTPLTYWSSIRSATGLALAEHRKEPFDVAYGHLTLSAVGPLDRLSAMGVPTVSCFYGPWYSEYAIESEELFERPWPYPLYLKTLLFIQRRLQARILRRSGMRVVLSDYSLKRAQELAVDLTGQEFVKIPGGVDPEVFFPLDETTGDKRAIRQRLNLDQDAFLLLTVRRLVKRMGIENLIRAVGFLINAGKPVKLVICGKGPEKEALARLVGELGLAEHVLFVGYVPDEVLPDFYRSCDLFCLPTAAEENFGLVILEAAACGCPVIATPVGSIPEVFNSLHPTFLCDDAGPEAMAEKIQWVRDQYEKVCWKFTAEISKNIRKNFSWDSIARRHLAEIRRSFFK